MNDKPHQLTMEDFSHLTEEQLNALTTGAKFLFTPTEPKKAQKPLADIGHAKKKPLSR